MTQNAHFVFKAMLGQKIPERLYFIRLFGQKYSYVLLYLLFWWGYLDFFNKTQNSFAEKLFSPLSE